VDKVDLNTDESVAVAWRRQPEVLSLLSKLLSDEMPTAAEVELARPLGGLSEAHIFELVELAASGLESAAPAVSQAAVFSCWLAALTVNLDDAEGLPAIRSATPNSSRPPVVLSPHRPHALEVEG
jgi:formate dehydrogenase maturation protein FdhE